MDFESFKLLISKGLTIDDIKELVILEEMKKRGCSKKEIDEFMFRQVMSI